MSVPLADSALGIHKITRSLTHEVVCPPLPLRPSSDDPKLAWEARYPAGSCSPKSKIPGGMGFYFGGPKEIVTLLEQGATEAAFWYRVMFEKGWDWVKGDGGIGDTVYGCSGGRRNDRCRCFDVRLMWRRGGSGEIYAYPPMNETNTKALLAVPPTPKPTLITGFQSDVALGSSSRVLGQQSQNVLNSTCELQLWINGVSVIYAKGLNFREAETSRIKGMHFQTIFGGHESDWTSPKHQCAWFADVSGAIIR